MLIDEMPFGNVATTRELLRTATDQLDAYRLGTLIAELAGAIGVVGTWERHCLPLLAGLPDAGPPVAPGQGGPGHCGIAKEHTLSEGIRIGLDLAGRPVPPARSGAVLLAAAEREEHCLGLHALGAALRERGQGALLLGAAVPWTALAAAVNRVGPRDVVVWAQTPATGREHRLIRLARALPTVRFFAAGPGWPPGMPAPVRILWSLTEAVEAFHQPR